MTNRILQLALFAALATVAHAQHGGPPGGGGGHGMPGGGGMGMPGGGMNNGQPRGPMTNGEGHSGMGNPGHGPQLGPNYRWWDDKKASKTLGLRPEQQQHMDDIFEANKGELITRFNNLRTEESKLSSMSSTDLADESKVFAGIDRVAQARAELEKQNAHILLQIRKELDAPQLSKLDSDLASR